MWQFADLGFAVHIFFAICELTICELKTYANPQILNFIFFKYKLKMLSFKFKDDFWLLRQFELQSISLSKIFLRGKENIRGKRIWIRNIVFSLQILPICDLRINHYKFDDLRFADWLNSEICGLTIVK
jgi:hypothetical protein